MLADREIIRAFTLEHLEGEGEYLLCSADDCCVGEDE